MSRRVRCAIYTRKSSEEGLEQSFNSLDAQREACEAYIKSQQHEGWQRIPTRYDDGGFSGGNIERPALKQLMADIQAGKVNVVVVYKVDRLTRSLADFAKIIEQFDKFGVSFVSITQQFNTTSSMGRLTLNVLLSFAQFEREVTGERIRDKIAASKKKGMWMGGAVPLGYTAQDRKLIVHETGAATVRTIFREFLRLGSVQRLQDWLRENNLRSRCGNHFFRGALYTMLRNSHYVGLIKHKQARHQGQHPAILDRETWDNVQALLSDNTQGKRRKTRTTKPSLFTGLLLDTEGTRYTPTHANKHGLRYRYYTSQAVVRNGEKGEVPGRIPAPDLEQAVVDCLLDLLRDPARLVAFVDSVEEESSFPEGTRLRLVEQARKLTKSWERMSLDHRQTWLSTILHRLVIHADHIEVQVDTGKLVELLLDTQRKEVALPAAPRIASLGCPFRHVPQGRALRLIVGSGNLATDASRQAILKAIARARVWYQQLTTGKAGSIRELAVMHGISRRFVHLHLRLIPLSPQSIEHLMTRSESFSLSLDDLLTRVRLNWNEQRFGAAGKCQKFLPEGEVFEIQIGSRTKDIENPAEDLSQAKGLLGGLANDAPLPSTSSLDSLAKQSGNRHAQRGRIHEADEDQEANCQRTSQSKVTGWNP